MTSDRQIPSSAKPVEGDPREPQAGRSVRLERVVTGIDFHPSAEAAARWVIDHFAPGAAHGLVHVVDLPELPGPLRGLGRDREQLRIAAHEEAQRRLDRFREGRAGPQVQIHIREGRPAPNIVRLAGEVEADLVVVGEQGPRRGITALLGSTAERVLFDSRVPVLLARKVPETPPRQLLVAIDDSEMARPVLAWAKELIRRFDATATVLNVVDRVRLADELTGISEARNFRQLEEEAARTMQAWLQETVREALPEPQPSPRVVLGDPSYEIIAEAARSKTDLILIGSRGGDVARTPLIGRIVNKVVRSAPCSVLVITNPERASAAGR